MPIINPKVARPVEERTGTDPLRRHERPVLKAGESLYVSDRLRPAVARDGTTGGTTPEDWADLRASVGGWGEADGSNYNLALSE